MDHIQGLPFFSPAFVAGQEIDIWGPQFHQETVQELLATPMRPTYFPVPFEKMGATIRCHRSESEWNVSGFQIRSLRLSHPGGVLAYRITFGGQSFVFATDCELAVAARNGRSDDRSTHGAWSPAHREFFSGADLLALDCQYPNAKYESHRGQGHNSTSMAAAVASEFRPGALALIHHDPSSSDTAIEGNVEEVLARLDGPVPVFAARDGLSIPVNAKR
jgi:ribonuclease BN (tRNA processing enzyme)